MASAPVIGIDLGTSTTCVAIVDDKGPRVLPDERGRTLIPSCVGVLRDGSLIVGHEAVKLAVGEPASVVVGVKRLVGRRMTDPQTAALLAKIAYQVESDLNGDVRVKVGERRMTTAQVSAEILRAAKDLAEGSLGCEVNEAVVTVPAHFNDRQRRATKEACDIVGLKLLRLLNEPTAAALAYGHIAKVRSQHVLVYDLGGGTFDVSLLKVQDNVHEVAAVGGDTYLGGTDVTNRLATRLIERFEAAHSASLGKDPMGLQRVFDAAERAKIALSEKDSTTVRLQRLAMKGSEALHMKDTVTRAELEELSRSFVERTLVIAQKTLEAAGWSARDVDALLLVGGQTRMPLVARMAQGFIGKAPRAGVNPEEAVALGAAIYGHMLRERTKTLLMDVVPLTLGIETQGGRFEPIIRANSKIPVTTTKTFTTIRDGQTKVPVLVYQGDGKTTGENLYLGEIVLEVEPAPRMEVKADVTFRVDANGMLTVSVKDKATSTKKDLTLDVRPKRAPAE